MNLVRYEDWALPGRAHPGSATMPLPSGRVYIHHTAGPSPVSPQAEVHLLRQYDDQHRAKGWAGLGYSFAVGPSGTVYEGRGQRVGAHTEGVNKLGYGVAFLGEFTGSVPTPAAIQAAVDLMQHLIAVGGLTPDFKLSGHRDWVKTACPGTALYRDLSQLRALVNQRKEPAMPEGPPVYKVAAPPVSISMTATGKGYVILCADGGVFSFGDAPYLGRVEEPAAGAWPGWNNAHS